MILQHLLISTTLSKHRKTRLVTPPPPPRSLHPSTPQVRVCPCMRACLRTSLCLCAGSAGVFFYVKLRRKSRNQVSRISGSITQRPLNRPLRRRWPCRIEFSAEQHGCTCTNTHTHTRAWGRAHTPEHKNTQILTVLRWSWRKERKRIVL